MPSMNISLTPELANIVQAKVTSGLYGNASEVVRDAIRRLDANEQLLYEMKLERLREILEPGVQQALAGKFAKEFSFDKLKSKLNKK